jgi:HNH endonuclease
MTRIPWKHDRCILCLLPFASERPRSEEHVIPDSLGGILTCRFLCKPCNDKLGQTFEAQARLAPELRRAVATLGAGLASLAESFEIGTRYRSEFSGETAEQIVGRNGQLGAAKLSGGSLIVPEAKTSKSLAGFLRASGASEMDVARATSAWESAQPGAVTDVGYGIAVRKWQDHPSTPTYSEPPLNALVPLKIAYEFAALLLGGAIYQPLPTLEKIREALANADEAFAADLVGVFHASKPAPFHGIAYQGNRPVAEFQVRLFGNFAYVVPLQGIAINHVPLVYTHFLDSGEDRVDLRQITERAE